MSEELCCMGTMWGEGQWEPLASPPPSCDAGNVSGLRHGLGAASTTTASTTVLV